MKTVWGIWKDFSYNQIQEIETNLLDGISIISVIENDGKTYAYSSALKISGELADNFILFDKLTPYLKLILPIAYLKDVS